MGRKSQSNYKLRARGELKLKVLDYLKNNSCIDCGECDPIVLEFDHKESISKKSTISRMINDVKSWVEIKEEISKCEIRCANCHKRKTAKQLGYWKQL